MLPIAPPGQARFVKSSLRYISGEITNNNKQCGRRFGRHAMPRPSVTLTFDRLTLNLVCELHLRWGTFIPNLDTLCFWVLELFPMYATD